MKSNRTNRRARQILAAAAAMSLAAQSSFAGTSANNAGPTQNGQGNDAVTISMSGSTALKNFTISPGITLLTPGTSITLANGPAGAGTTYTAPSGSLTSVQLASGNFATADSPQPLSYGTVSSDINQNHSAIRFEWHEQGSVEGILDLTNDQVGYAGGVTGTPIVDPGTRNPVLQTPLGSHFSNPIWVNRNVWDGSNASKSVGNTVGTGATQNGLALNYSDYNTYSPATYNLATGQNLQGGQNRVQMAQSDVNGTQAFAISGAPGSMNAVPLVAGYGQGNSAAGLTVGSLPVNGPAQAGARWTFHDQSALNMPTTNIDPQTGQNYTAGPWNTGGVTNMTNHAVAVSATLFVANPGTGLERLNRTDAQWLQTSGRLANGADFNMSTRDVGSGTRNVSAMNVGVDPTWAVGENDSGNGNDQLAGQTAQDQLNIGSAMRFSNKTAGGGQLRPTVQNNRMSIGTLGISDAIGSVRNNASSTPIRSLDYADAPSDNGANFVRASATSITDGTYVIYQNENYVTIKAPNATYANSTAAEWAALNDSQTGIKGDNAAGNVAAFRSNILGAIANFPPSSVANPADQLLANSFILPQMMQVEKVRDGIGQSQPNPLYNQQQHDAFVGSSYANNFAVADPSTVTTGSNSSYGNAGNNMTAFNGPIPITSQNYLFGNFNQNGTRDFSAVKSAIAAQAALASSGAGVSMFTADGGQANSTPVTTGIAALDAMNGGAPATKGDLIVMGDFNGDGKFDGQDLYIMAHGAALADNAGTDHLTSTSGATFADQVRNGVLLKNQALDYLDAHATAQQHMDARVVLNGSSVPAGATDIGTLSDGSHNYTFDATGANAFNKFDVNRDGKIDLNDAAVVDKFVGSDYRNLSNQLAATINTDGSVHDGAQKTFDLVNAELNDNGTITATINQDGSGTSDFKLIRDALGSKLLNGDTNFDGKVDFTDLLTLAQHYGMTTGMKWSTGDFFLTGTVNFADLLALAQNYGQSAPTASQLAELTPAFQADVQAAFAAVPEPGMMSLLSVAGLALVRRRRRSC